MNLPIDGGCRCGRVRIRVTEAPWMTMACHCHGCQRMSSSAFSLTAIFPSTGFAVTQGETVVGGIHGPDGQHMFCAYCMSWMFTLAREMPHIVNVRPTMLDDVSWFAPHAETYTSTKLAFASTGAVRSYPEFPPMAEYETLMKEYVTGQASARRQ